MDNQKKLEAILNNIQSLRANMIKLIDDCENELNFFKDNIEDLIEKKDELITKTKNKIFDIKFKNLDQYRLIYRAFSDTVPNWADILIPVMEKMTGEKWYLQSEWFTERDSASLLTKMLYDNKKVNSYIVQLTSDNNNLPSLVFFEEYADWGQSLGIVKTKEILKEGQNFKFLPNSELDLNAFDKFMCLSAEHKHSFYIKGGELKFKFVEDYPFLKDVFMNHAYNYFETHAEEVNSIINKHGLINLISDKKGAEPQKNSEYDDYSELGAVQQIESDDMDLEDNDISTDLDNLI